MSFNAVLDELAGLGVYGMLHEWHGAEPASTREVTIRVVEETIGC